MQDAQVESFSRRVDDLVSGFSDGEEDLFPDMNAMHPDAATDIVQRAMQAAGGQFISEDHENSVTFEQAEDAGAVGTVLSPDSVHAEAPSPVQEENSAEPDAPAQEENPAENEEDDEEEGGDDDDIVDDEDVDEGGSVEAEEESDDAMEEDDHVEGNSGGADVSGILEAEFDKQRTRLAECVGKEVSEDFCSLALLKTLRHAMFIAFELQTNTERRNMNDGDLNPRALKEMETFFKRALKSFRDMFNEHHYLHKTLENMDNVTSIVYSDPVVLEQTEMPRVDFITGDTVPSGTPARYVTISYKSGKPRYSVWVAGENDGVAIAFLTMIHLCHQPDVYMARHMQMMFASYTKRPVQTFVDDFLDTANGAAVVGECFFEMFFPVVWMLTLKN